MKLETTWGVTAPITGTSRARSWIWRPRWAGLPTSSSFTGPSAATHAASSSSRRRGGRTRACTAAARAWASWRAGSSSPLRPASACWASSIPRAPTASGASSWAKNPRQEVKEALRLALEQAGRPGEVPSFVLLTAPPGREEDLLLGIADVVGAHVPVTGGSSGDEAVTGNWWQAANRTVGSALAVVTVLFPSGAVVSSFQAGYEVMNLSGKSRAPAGASCTRSTAGPPPTSTTSGPAARSPRSSRAAAKSCRRPRRCTRWGAARARRVASSST